MSRHSMIANNSDYIFATLEIRLIMCDNPFRLIQQIIANIIIQHREKFGNKCLGKQCIIQTIKAICISNGICYNCIITNNTHKLRYNITCRFHEYNREGYIETLIEIVKTIKKRLKV